jgi:membrane protease YdiL (CAAX protease family)
MSPSSSVGRRAAVELSGLAVATGLFLTAVPERPVVVDAALGLLAITAVALSWRDTRHRFWGVPGAPPPQRARGVLLLLAATGIVAAGFGTAAAIRAYLEAAEWVHVLGRVFPPTFFLALVLYTPWALLQQTLFQFYLLGRLSALLPSRSPFFVCAVSGTLYGALHLPDWELTLVTLPAGIVWSYAYHYSRSLLAVALSHAVLGTAYYYWIRDRDLILHVLSKL